MYDCHIEIQPGTQDTERCASNAAPYHLKQALLDYAHRTPGRLSNVSMVVVSLINSSAIESVAGFTGRETIMNTAFRTIFDGADESAVVLQLNPFQIVILQSKLCSTAAAIYVTQLLAQLHEIRMSGHPIRPVFRSTCWTDEIGELSRLTEADNATVNQVCILQGSYGVDSLPHIGKLEEWCQRYTLKGSPERIGPFTRHRVIDTWQHTDRWFYSFENVGSKGFSFKSTSQRARLLQSLNHAHIQPLMDFWLDGTEMVCVEQIPKTKPVYELMNTHILNSAALYDLMLQYLSVFTHLSSLTPPVVLPDLHKRLHIAPEQCKLSLTNFQHEALLDSSLLRPSETIPTNESIFSFVDFLLRTLPPSELDLASTTLHWKTFAGPNLAHKLKQELTSSAKGLGSPRAIARESISHA